ncbi:unnamed protein product [Heligmosomoides polygyrus]|uniref:Secreted protein n=1 Tax=Heligmosomoides polygyrus TaxID=6339 RepID=A0A183G0E2_HELPZ|nr:unnamed protein product [Heligmosomoides polygyrus]
MVLWRAVGINYVRFSQIAALTTRKCIKTDSVHGLKKAAHPASLKVRLHSFSSSLLFVF